MKTNEYDALTLVISSKYRCQESVNGKLQMEESVSGLPPQVISLRSDYKDVDGFSLYRFEDKEKILLLPFFNHNNDNVGEERKSPKYLVSMCDYMSICSYKDQTYVFLFELKRGTTVDYQKQLEAGEYLLNYFYDSIDRIKSYDGIDFDRRVIRIKKFQVKQVKSNKQKIQPVSTISGSGDCFIVETNNELGLLKLLKES